MFILAIRFLLELVGVAALTWWGIAVADGPLAAVLAVAAPLTLIVAWGLVAAPKARNPLSLRARQLAGSAMLLVVAAAVALAGQPAAAALFGAAIVVDQALLVLVNPDVAALVARAPRQHA